MEFDPSDLLGRLQRFAQAGDARLLMVGMAVMLGLLILAALNMRMTLIWLNLLALVFADSANDALASGATLARWAIIFLISLTNIWGAALPGLPILLLAGYGLIAVIASPIALTPLFAIQTGVLMLVTTLGFGSALTSRLRSFDDVLVLLKMILIVAGVWVLVSVWTIPQMVMGLRFTGAGTSAPLFAITGGLFLPIALWGSFDAGSGPWRWYSRGLGLCVLFLLALSGQRTGAIAGLVGCAPMLLRRGLTVFRVAVVSISLAVLAIFLVIRFFPAQTAFVVARYEQGGFGGREGRWLMGLYSCLRAPLLPHGAGSADDITGIGFHNAFLVAWFEGGLIGLILFLTAFGALLHRGLRIVFHSDQPRVVAVARLAICVFVVLILTAFAESKLVSPSNLLITMTVLFATILYRLNLPEARTVPSQLPSALPSPAAVAP